MDKKSYLILAASILLGFIMLGIILKLPIENLSYNLGNKGYIENLSELYRYQMISVNDTNIIIFDRETGEYWRKFVPPNEGPTEWTREKIPDYNEK